MNTLRLDCRCGAYLEQRERNPMRLGMAREEFEAQHGGEGCAVSEGRRLPPFPAALRGFCPHGIEVGGEWPCWACPGNVPTDIARTKKGED